MTEQAPTAEAIIINERVELRPLVLADAEEIFRAIDRSRETLQEWLPWVKGTKTVADSEAFIRAMESEREAGKQLGFGIFVDGKPSGHISLMNIDPNKPVRAEIGYWIDNDVSGQGITTEAVRALSDYAFQSLGLQHLELRADAKNVASQRVAEKAGFAKAGSYVNKEGVFRYGELTYEYELDKTND